MKSRISGVLIAFGIVSSSAFGDSYGAFQTKRFYSQNRRFFVEVRENKRAILYRNGRRLRKLWQRDLSELPRKLMVTNDGTAIAIVDFYYGNNCRPDAPVLMIFGPGGDEL